MSSAQTVHRHTYNQNREDPCVEEEEDVNSTIINADTVVDPGAVMVVTLHTDIADGTVSRARCSNQFTVGAQILRFELSQQVFEFVRFVSFTGRL